jgi:hypothetical protein
VAFPVLGNEFVRSLESDLKELASDIVGMTYIVERHEGDHVDDEEADELVEILRELDNTRLWRTLVCAGTASASLINQICEVLRDCRLRSLARHSFSVQMVVKDDALAM